MWDKDPNMTRMVRSSQNRILLVAGVLLGAIILAALLFGNTPHFKI